MRCEFCSSHDPSEYVELHYNVGMLFMRRQYDTRAHLCRACLRRTYLDYQLRNATLGWWGTISFFATAYFLLANTAVFVRALGRLRHAKPTVAARIEVIDASAALARLHPFEHNVRLRLQGGESVEEISEDLATLQDVALVDAAQFVEQVQREHAAR